MRDTYDINPLLYSRHPVGIPSRNYVAVLRTHCFASLSIHVTASLDASQRHQIVGCARESRRAEIKVHHSGLTKCMLQVTAHITEHPGHCPIDTHPTQHRAGDVPGINGGWQHCSTAHRAASQCGAPFMLAVRLIGLVPAMSCKSCVKLELDDFASVHTNTNGASPDPKTYT